MKSTNGVLFWDVSFFRGVHARELKAMTSFMDTIYGATIKGFGEDKMRWKLDRNKGFIVNNYYGLLAGDQMRWKWKPNGAFDIWSYYNKLKDSPSTVFTWKAIWRAKAPRRVSFFVWCVAWNKILTGDNLRLRRLDFVDWCIMCRHCGETVDHLLLHCEMAYRLWSFVFITFGLSWVIPRSIPDLLFGWWNWLGKHSSQI